MVLLIILIIYLVRLIRQKYFSPKSDEAPVEETYPHDQYTDEEAHIGESTEELTSTAIVDEAPIDEAQNDDESHE